MTPKVLRHIAYCCHRREGYSHATEGFLVSQEYNSCNKRHSRCFVCGLMYIAKSFTP
jgi:hypothetical protein